MSSDTRLLKFILLTNLNIYFVWGHGQNTFQCPTGYYLSQFSSAYDGSERFYKFGCAKFGSNIMVNFKFYK